MHMAVENAIYCRNDGPQSHVQQNLLFLGIRNPAMPNANERITRHRNTVPAYIVHTDVELAELLCRVQTKSTTVTDAYTHLSSHTSSKQMYKIQIITELQYPENCQYTFATTTCCIFTTDLLYKSYARLGWFPTRNLWDDRKKFLQDAIHVARPTVSKKSGNKITVLTIIVIIPMKMFVVLSSWQEFTWFIW